MAGAQHIVDGGQWWVHHPDQFGGRTQDAAVHGPLHDQQARRDGHGSSIRRRTGQALDPGEQCAPRARSPTDMGSGDHGQARSARSSVVPAVLSSMLFGLSPAGYLRGGRHRRRRVVARQRRVEVRDGCSHSGRRRYDAVLTCGRMIAAAESRSRHNGAGQVSDSTRFTARRSGDDTVALPQPSPAGGSQPSRSFGRFRHRTERVVVREPGVPVYRTSVGVSHLGRRHRRC